MSIQWSLVIFTLLTGTAGWMLVCTAIDVMRGKNSSKAFMAVLVVLILTVVGGLASVTHLSHPDRMMAALGHPTSGIFTEAVLVGIIVVLCAVFLIVDKRKIEGARKVFAVLAAIFGAVISFMAGESYIMASTSTWNTQLLPLAYALTSVPAGVAAYLTVLGKQIEEGSLSVFSTLLIAGGAGGALVSFIYTVAVGAFGMVPLELWGGVVICGGIAPVVCGVLMRKQPEKAQTLAIVALVGALIGALALRCIMWEIYELVALAAPYITDYSIL